MKKTCISLFIIISCMLFTSCASNNAELYDSCQTAFEYSHSLAPRSVIWTSFDEIAELKKTFEQEDDKTLLGYLNEYELRPKYGSYFFCGLESKEDVKKLFEQIDSLKILSLDESCELKLSTIRYYFDDPHLLIRYQKGVGSKFECAFALSIYPIDNEDSELNEFSNNLLNFPVIDSVNVNLNHIDFYAKGSYKNAYSNVMYSMSCFETDNSYIIICYDTVAENAVLDPCVKEHLQLTSLNDLIG